MSALVHMAYVSGTLLIKIRNRYSRDTDMSLFVKLLVEGFENQVPLSKVEMAPW